MSAHVNDADRHATTPHVPLTFIHVPKTSGQSMNGEGMQMRWHAFNVPFEDTGVANTVHPLRIGRLCIPTVYSPPLDDAVTVNRRLEFTVVRNPFDIICSLYHHGRHGWLEVNQTYSLESFAQFVRAFCAPGTPWVVPLLHQFLFSQLFDASHECAVPLIVKYERFDDAADKMRAAGMRVMDRRNVNISVRRNSRAFAEFYTPELRGLVERKCARELAMFGYTFDNTKNACFVVLGDQRYDVANDVAFESVSLDGKLRDGG